MTKCANLVHGLLPHIPISPIAEILQPAQRVGEWVNESIIDVSLAKLLVSPILELEMGIIELPRHTQPMDALKYLPHIAKPSPEVVTHSNAGGVA